MKKLFCFAAFVAVTMAPLMAEAQGVARSFDIRGAGGLYSHSPSDPVSDWTFLGPAVDPEDEYDVIAFDTDSAGTLWTVDLNTLILGTLDPLTAEFTTVTPLSGDVPPSVVGMTIDTSTDIAYVTDGNGLWTLDLGTGTATMVAAAFDDSGIGGAVTSVFELATDSAGNFWAFDVAADNLWSLDETTGVVTFITNYNAAGGIGDPNFSNNGMDWDADSGRLIADVYTGGGTGSYGFWDLTNNTFVELVNHTAFPAPSTGAHGGPIACDGGITFQVDFWNDAFQVYDTDPVANLVTMPQPVLPAIFALDYDAAGSTLFAIDNNSLNFGTMDEDTGIFTPVVTITGDIVGGTPIGISQDPVSGTWYVAGPTNLFTLDPVTGVTTFVAAFTPPAGQAQTPDLAIEIAFNSLGELYMFSSGTDDSLYQVDITNGEATFVGAAPVAAGGFIQGMDFDPADDTLYGAIYIGTGTGLYGIWDTTTGAFTTIVALENLPNPGDGYELKLAIGSDTVDPIDIFPTQAVITQGVLTGGTVGDLAADDTVDYRVSRNPNGLQPVVQFELKSVSSIANPSAISLTINESVFSRPNVVRRIELFNYTTSTWDEIDIRSSYRFGDRTDVVMATGTISDYVEPGTGCVEARMRYTAAIGRAAFTANIDQVFWTIDP